MAPQQTENLEKYPLDPAWIAIAPMRLPLIESYHDCLQSVCAEGKYMMSSCAPELHVSRRFVENLLADDMPMFVALTPGPQVIGWCDMYRSGYETQAHVGRIGMGLHARYRSMGLGTLLLERTLKKSRLAGIERIELDVFSTNHRAIGLYNKMGFEVEGVKRRARKVVDTYEDIVMMAKIL